MVKMRVLCITSHSDRPEAETFISLRAAGVDLEVICHPEAPHIQRLRDAGVPVTAMALKGRHDKKGTAAIRERLQENNYDILHLYNNKAAANGIRAARGIDLKIICYRGIVGNVSYLDPASWGTYLHPRVDRIVCVAEAIRKYFLDMRCLWMRMDPNKVRTIHKGHDLSWYQDQPGDLTQFGIPEDAFTVGCIANIRPRKGIDVLIEAARHLPIDAPVHFLLVGNMDNEKLQQQIAQSPWRDRIHLTGYRTDAPALMAACDVSVLPAIKREGLPKVVIESMAYGTPAIVTDSGGSPELIEQGKNGLIVPSGEARPIAEAIMALQMDPEMLAMMGMEAKKRIGTAFRVESTMEKTLALYRELVPGSCAAPS